MMIPGGNWLCGRSESGSISGFAGYRIETVVTDCYETKMEGESAVISITDR